jgi:hypothetical protein
VDAGAGDLALITGQRPIALGAPENTAALCSLRLPERNIPLFANDRFV